MTTPTGRRAVAAPSAEASRVQGLPSGLVTRSAANIIDFVVAAGLVGCLYVGVAALEFLWHPQGFTFPSPPSLPTVIFIGGWVTGLYFTLSWLATGRTYGDFVLGLRVVDRDGQRLRPGLAIVRAFACVVCPIGLLWVALDRANRSVQDLLLRTRVVYDWSEALPTERRRA